MILVLDNYDSFTFNLVQYLGEINPDLRVVRNDEFSVPEILKLKPTHIVVSPGPCTPIEAGISVELIRDVPASIPLLGVCLGHQAIGQAFGGKVIRAPAPMHGKTALIENDGAYLFRGLPAAFTATRYHSLIVSSDGLPEELAVTATCKDAAALQAAAGGAGADKAGADKVGADKVGADKVGADQTGAGSQGELIMALRHKQRPIFGLQFHPESILTEHGKQMIRNFLEMKGN